MRAKTKIKRDLSKALHSSALALQKVGALDKDTMRVFDCRHSMTTPDLKPDNSLLKEKQISSTENNDPS